MNAERDFELLKLLVEDVREARRARRDLANVFTTLNLAGVGALGFLRANDGAVAPALLGWLVVALVFTCVIWWTSNAYYTRLLGVKYKIINGYEERLGESPFRQEWKDLGQRPLFKFFSLEKAMPVLFVLGYGVFMAHTMTWTAFATTVTSLLEALLGLLPP